MKKIFIIGGGIAGMFCAYLLAKKKCGYEITIIEKNSFLGGAFSSYKTPEKYIFDIGIHILYSTSIKEVDDIFFDVLPEDEWNILIGNKKDVAGVFFRGRLFSCARRGGS
jgi:protoporphyrinogen oxidase